MKITIQFDGGCRPTNPGKKYGSFEVTDAKHYIGGEYRFELGWGTNNEAEFESLIKAMDFVNRGLAESGLPQSEYTLKLLTDSTVLMNRLNGRNKTTKNEPQKRMQALADRCLYMLRPYKSFTVEWHGRANNVKAFGH